MSKIRIVYDKGKTTLEVDGRPLQGCSGVDIRMRAGENLPEVTFVMVPLELEIEIDGAKMTVAAEVDRLVAAGAAQAIRPILAADDIGPPVRLPGQLPGASARAHATRYASLPIAKRVEILTELGLIGSDEIERTLQRGDGFDPVEGKAFERARAQGKIPAFFALIDEAFESDDVSHSSTSSDVAKEETSYEPTRCGND